MATGGRTCYSSINHGLLIVVLLVCSCECRVDRSQIDLHIGGLFPISGTGGWQGGSACLPAAQMALDDVNKAGTLLPGYRLVLHWNDSEVS